MMLRVWGKPGGSRTSRALRRGRRFALLALGVAILAALGAGAAAAAAQPVVYGIGDQKVGMFTDPRFAKLGLGHARRVVAWDAFEVGWQRRELKRWMNAAQAAGVEPLIAFTRSRREGRERVLPSPQRLARTFREFRRRYRWVDHYTPWNEANHCSQPTCRNPRMAARYYNMMRARCRRCTIVAADVLDQPNMVSWLREFRRHTRGDPRIWGLHNYLDVNRFRMSGTQAMLRAVRGEIWITEVGGIVKRRASRAGATRIRLGESAAHAAQAMRWLFRVTRVSPRIKRVYVYHWNGSRDPSENWDSGLIAPDGKPRPAFWIFRRQLRAERRHGRAAPAISRTAR